MSTKEITEWNVHIFNFDQKKSSSSVSFYPENTKFEIPLETSKFQDLLKFNPILAYFFDVLI